MGKKTGVFTENQLVFAKVKGYSPWPAKITKFVAKGRYKVYFYGTGETANVKSEDLDPYDEKNRSRFNSDRQLKKNDYKEAVDQIEAALVGNDPAPIVPDDSSKNHNDLDFTDNSADESQLQIAEDAPKSTPLPPKKKTLPKFKAEPVAVLSIVEVKKEGEKKTSRSGRQLKKKDLNNDEMDPDEMFGQPRKRTKIEDSKPPKLGNAASALEDFHTSKIHILNNPEKRGKLDHQFEMLQLMTDIRHALGLELVDVDRALELFLTFKEKILPHITNLMLLKYPNTVDNVKRLRNYIGNLHIWNMDEAEVEQFREKANKIRHTAIFIYDKFKTLFNYPENTSFYSQFREDEKAFHEKYSSVDSADLFQASSYNELDTFVNNRTNNVEVAEIPPIDAIDTIRESKIDEAMIDEQPAIEEKIGTVEESSQIVKDASDN